jgi:hypothetical protein
VEWGQAAKQWNKLQRKAGYLNTYAQEHKHYNPNSIDIHTVQNLKDIEAYLVKYITKGDKYGRIIKGKIWGCSNTLEGQRFTTEIDGFTESQMTKYPMKCLEYCTIIETPGQRLLSPPANIEYHQVLNNIKQ